MEGYQRGGGWGIMEEKIHGIKSIIQNRWGEVKNSIGNGEAKELICMTHGQELKSENDGGKRDTGWRGIKGRKKWYNSNSIINKLY